MKLKNRLKGLSIIIRTEEQFLKVSKFIGETYCYLNWLPVMAERETAIVVWAKKKTNRSTGSVGCANTQREYKIRTIEYTEFFI